jgi:hypothetical protein
MFISPSYIFTCTLKNGIYFGFKNHGIFTQREAETFIWSYAKNTRPCPSVSPGTISEPDQSILREHWVFFSSIIPVYNNTEDFGMMINWNGLVRPQVR